MSQNRNEAKNTIAAFLTTVTDPAQRAALEAALNTATTPKAGGGGERGPTGHEQMLTLVREAGDEGLDARILFEKLGWAAYNINIAMRKVIQEEADRDKFVWLAFDGNDRTYTGAISGDTNCTYQHIVIVAEGADIPEGWTGFVPSQRRENGRWFNANKEERKALGLIPDEPATESATESKAKKDVPSNDEKAAQQTAERNAVEAETGTRPPLIDGRKRNKS